MKKINTELLRAGISFTKPLYIDEDSIFLQPGVPLKQKEIDRLKRWEIPEVTTDGDLIRPKPPAPASPEEKTGIQRGYSLSDSKGIDLYHSAVDRMETIIREIMRGQRIEHDRIDSVVNDLLTAVEKDQSNIIQLILLSAEESLKLSDSSVKSAILSIIIGRNMKMLSFRLMQLTTGALLHDIGMIKVPAEIRMKKGKLTPEELKQVRTHPVYGYRIIMKELQYPEEVAAIALLHQEKWDGTGYPRRLKGEDIPLGARIVTVADAFVAMVNKRSYRDVMIGYRAMKNVLGANGRHFDPQVIKALIMSVGIYPIGSLVLLNNSGIGKVTATHSQAPLRPMIELIIDEFGDRLDQPVTVDLLEQKGLFIAKAIDPNTTDRMGDEQQEKRG